MGDSERQPEPIPLPVGQLARRPQQQPGLRQAARRQQVQAATHTFETELTAIAGELLSSLGSGNVEAELRNAQPQLKAALNKLAADYKQALAPISCS